MPRPSSEKIAHLMTPDLVLLSLLAERPMHGYAANLLLEQRMVCDWAGVSRPQVYYSLQKLARLGLIRTAESDNPAPGPERSEYAITAAGRTAIADALEREDWTTQQGRPAFLTWTALSWQARPGVFLKQVARRHAFLEKELKRKQETLRAVRKEVGHRSHEAVWMIGLNIDQIRAELRWLHKVTREFPRRAAARNPRYIPKEKQ